MNEEFKPCPFCGKTDVGVKDNVIDVRLGYAPASAIRKIWAYCRYCGAEGRKLTREVVGDDSVMLVAIEGWNERKDGAE